MTSEQPNPGAGVAQRQRGVDQTPPSLTPKTDGVGRLVATSQNDAKAPHANQEGLPAPEADVVGVVLAAGRSRRMGRPKALLPCRGEALVHRVARQADAAGLAEVWVVVGAWQRAVRAALADLPVRVVVNPWWSQGQSASVRVAGQALRAARAQAALFFLTDQPFVPAALVQGLCAAWRDSQAAIVAPRIAGAPGTPVLLSARVFPHLANLQGDQGARALFPHFPPFWLPWPDPRAAITLETWDDYRRVCPQDARRSAATWSAG